MLMMDDDDAVIS